MKKLVISLLFGILLINTSVLYAQTHTVDSVQKIINKLQTEQTNLQKQINNLEQQQSQLYMKKNSITYQLNDLNDKLKAELNNLKKIKEEENRVKEARAGKIFEGQVRADLKTLSKIEFCEKYGEKDKYVNNLVYSFKDFFGTFEGGYLRTHETTAITPLQVIVKEELAKGKTVKKLWAEYLGNELMEQAIIKYHAPQFGYHDIYSQYLHPGSTYPNLNEYIKFWETISAFAEDKVNWLNQHFWEARSHHDWLEGFFIEANKQPEGSYVKKNIAYLQDSVIKGMIIMAGDHRIDWIKKEAIPLFNFKNLGPQHIQKEYVQKMFVEKGIVNNRLKLEWLLM